MNQRYIQDKFTIDELLRKSFNHKGSTEFIKFFNFISRFQHYSHYNTMLVYMQNDAVTFFGGTSFWRKKFNRTIKEDGRPYVILAPMGPVMLVYDVLDTVGIESPEEFLKKGLGNAPFEVKGKLDRFLYEEAIAQASHLGVKINFKEQSYFTGGFITNLVSGKLEIVLNKAATMEESFSTLIHELAHLFLGHTGHKELNKIGSENKIRLLQRKLSRTTQELEAESVSFLVCKRLGLETRSAEYISGYIKNDQDILNFSYEVVIKIADKIEGILKLKS